MLTLHGHRQYDAKKVQPEKITALEAMRGDVFDEVNDFCGFVMGSVVYLDGGGKFWVQETVEAIETMIEDAMDLSVWSPTVIRDIGEELARDAP